MYYDQKGISRHYNTGNPPTRHGSTSSDHSDSGRRRYSGRADALGTSSFVTGPSYGSGPGSSSYVGRSHTVDYTPANGSLPRYGARSHDMDRSGILRRAYTADSSSRDFTTPHFTPSRLTDLDPKRTTTSRWGHKDTAATSDMSHRGGDAAVSSQTSIHDHHGSPWRSHRTDHPRSARWPESKTDSPHYHHSEAASSGYSSMSRSGSSRETADSSGSAPWRLSRSKTIDDHDAQTSSRRSSQDSQELKSDERDSSLRRRRHLRDEKIDEGEAKEPERSSISESKPESESTDQKRRARPYLSRAKTIDVPCPTPKEKTESAPERPWRTRLDKSEAHIKEFLDQKYGVHKTSVNGEDTGRKNGTSHSKVVASRMEPPEVKHSVVIGETREERIARYKEQRRKELAEKYGVTDKSDSYQVSGKTSFKTPNLTAYTRTSPRETKTESKEEKPTDGKVSSSPTRTETTTTSGTLLTQAPTITMSAPSTTTTQSGPSLVMPDKRKEGGSQRPEPLTHGVTTVASGPVSSPRVSPAQKQGDKSQTSATINIATSQTHLSSATQATKPTVTSPETSRRSRQSIRSPSPQTSTASKSESAAISSSQQTKLTPPPTNIHAGQAVTSSQHVVMPPKSSVTSAASQVSPSPMHKLITSQSASKPQEQVKTIPSTVVGRSPEVTQAVKQVVESRLHGKSAYSAASTKGSTVIPPGAAPVTSPTTAAPKSGAGAIPVTSHATMPSRPGATPVTSHGPGAMPPHGTQAPVPKAKAGMSPSSKSPSPTAVIAPATIPVRSRPVPASHTVLQAKEVASAQPPSAAQEAKSQGPLSPGVEKEQEGKGAASPAGRGVLPVTSAIGSTAPQVPLPAAPKAATAVTVTPRSLESQPQGKVPHTAATAVVASQSTTVTSQAAADSAMRAMLGIAPGEVKRGTPRKFVPPYVTSAIGLHGNRTTEVIAGVPHTPDSKSVPSHIVTSTVATPVTSSVTMAQRKPVLTLSKSPLAVPSSGPLSSTISSPSKGTIPQTVPVSMVTATTSHPSVKPMVTMGTSSTASSSVIQTATSSGTIVTAALPSSVMSTAPSGSPQRPPLTSQRRMEEDIPFALQGAPKTGAPKSQQKVTKGDLSSSVSDRLALMRQTLEDQEEARQRIRNVQLAHLAPGKLKHDLLKKQGQELREQRAGVTQPLLSQKQSDRVSDHVVTEPSHSIGGRKPDTTVSQAASTTSQAPSDDVDTTVTLRITEQPEEGNESQTPTLASSMENLGIPLPKDSVIARNRRMRLDSTSSSDSQPASHSPRISPRAARRHKKQQSSESSTSTDLYGLATRRGFHVSSRNGKDRPPEKDAPGRRSPRMTSDSGSSSIHAIPGGQTITSPKGSVLDSSMTKESDEQRTDQRSPILSPGVLSPPEGSAGRSRKDRRRFRKREDSLEETPEGVEIGRVKVKKDKSSKRKSALNRSTSEDAPVIQDVPKTSRIVSDESQESSETRRRRIIRQTTAPATVEEPQATEQRPASTEDRNGSQVAPPLERTTSIEAVQPVTTETRPKATSADSNKPVPHPAQQKPATEPLSQDTKPGTLKSAATDAGPVTLATNVSQPVQTPKESKDTKTGVPKKKPPPLTLDTSKQVKDTALNLKPITPEEKLHSVQQWVEAHARAVSPPSVKEGKPEDVPKLKSPVALETTKPTSPGALSGSKPKYESTEESYLTAPAQTATDLSDTEFTICLPPADKKKTEPSPQRDEIKGGETVAIETGILSTSSPPVASTDQEVTASFSLQQDSDAEWESVVKQCDQITTEVESAISRYKDSNQVPKAQEEAEHTPSKKVTTGARDVARLVKRFSESDASSIEGERARSPTPKVTVIRKPEIPAALREVTGLRETATKDAPEEEKTDDVTKRETKPPTEEVKLRHHGAREDRIRRTPERTQSMRERPTPDREKRASPQRAASFREKSDTVVVKRRKPQSDQPSDELAKILNRRSKTIEDWELQVATNGTSAAERAIQEYEEQLEAQKLQKQKEKVIVDSQLQTALQARRAIVASEVGADDVFLAEPKQNSEEEADGMSIEATFTLSSTVTVDDEPADEAPRYVEPSKFSRTEKKSAHAEQTVTLSEVKTKEVPPSVQDGAAQPVVEVEDTAIEKDFTAKKLELFEKHRQASESEPDVSATVATSPRNIVLEEALQEGADIEEIKQIKPVSALKEAFEKDKASGTQTPPMKLEPVPLVQKPPLKKSETLPLETKPKVKLEKTSSVEEQKSPVVKSPLYKAKSAEGAVLLDPQLASVLKARRELEGTEGKEVEEKGDEPVRSVSPLPEADEEGQKVLSVRERISQMQSHIEATTPKAESGRSTPRRMRLRPHSAGASGVTSPRPNIQPEKGDTPLSDDQLLAKLSSFAEVQGTAAMRRQRFQQRSRDDWRVRTQPVTEFEVKEADQLDSVMIFRSEIMRKATTAMLKLQEEQSKAKVPPITSKKTKGCDTFPQPFHRVKLRDRRHAPRYKTMPITLQDLGDIPELEPISKTTPLGIKCPSWSRRKLNAQRKKAASMSAAPVEKTIEETPENTKDDSEEEFDRLVEINYREITDAKPDKVEKMQQMTMEMDVPEDDMSKLSLSEKMTMFKQLEKTSTVEEESKEKKKSVGAKRFLDKKRRERSMTQPITVEEVTQAAEAAEKQRATTPERIRDTLRQPEIVNRPRDQTSKDTETESEDELSKLSLAEKMKLFSQQKEEKQQSAKKDAPVMRRKARRTQSRFKTQPVTSEEVEKARISPLAMSLVKPPDPELLQSMSLKDQRAFMAQWAETTLSQMGSGSKSGSQPGSRKSSVGEEEKDKTQHKGILKCPESADSEVKGILKSEKQTTPEKETIRGILKTDEVGESRTETRGILKHHEGENGISVEGKTVLKQTETSHEIRGILKQTETTPEQKGPSSETRGILKQTPSVGETKGILKQSPPHGVLRKDSLSDEQSETKSILKKESALKQSPPQGVLRKDSLPEDLQETRSILKKDSSFDQPLEIRGILKEPSFEKDSEDSHHGILKGKIGAESGSSTVDTEISETVTTVTKEGASVTTVTRVSTMKQEVTSSTESDSSEGRQKHGGIKNEAIAARRRMKEIRKTGERFHTQPIESTATETPDTVEKRRAKPVTVRHFTQPITSSEKEEAEEVTTPSLPDGSTIANRLAALQHSGEVGWKRRVKSELIDDSVKTERPRSIADRLNWLEGAQEGWKHRVEEKDVKQFTVEGKLNRAGKSMTHDSPLMGRKKRTPKKVIQRAQSSPNLLPVHSEDDSDEKPTKVEVPRVDDETFTQFFRSKTTEDITSEKVEVSIDDFNHVFIESQDILTSTKRIRPQKRKSLRKSKNPLKALAARDDLQQEYTEVRTDVAERELRRVNREKISSGAGLAQEALAGLASSENFNQIKDKLRKADSFSGSTPGGTARYEPYKDVMLMQVKGRRMCQLRLVEPSPRSVNSGDCFLLVTPEKVYCWLGEYCNVIERAKATEMASLIAQKKDLGCRTTSEPAIISEEKQRIGAGKYFWAALGSEEPYNEPGPNEEDEFYEVCMTETNMVYELQGDSLVPNEEYWGALPKHEMLDSKKALVFDFGSEMYVWTGKQVAFAARKTAIRLAREIWDQGYDYTECDINPLCPLETEEDGGLPNKAAERPDWALFGKVNENMETILFRDKFADWPDSSRLIKAKGQDDDKDKNEPLPELQPYDEKKMIPLNTSPVTLKLEGSNVGRGTKWVEIQEGLRREFAIHTLDIAVWHVLEYDIFKLDKLSYGQFHEGDTYVVRWHYMVGQSGMKDLKGQAARRTFTGRERCCYFFWQGNKSSINEKGASALMTVELDEERGPQVRVTEGKEPPCFTSLFDGTMIVYIGKREEEETNTSGPFRFYIVRNEMPSEVYLIEVPTGVEQLRSRGSFLLLNVKTGQLFIWHGAKSSQSTRQRAVEVAQKMAKKCPQEVGLHEKASIVITEMDEGAERAEFWAGMETRGDRSLYHSLLKDPRPQTHTPRLFYMNSVSGVFEATEILNPMRHPDVCSPFPFMQIDLHRASQPALFMLDNDFEVYLWQGWWPEGTEDVENVKTGSAHARLNVDRRCAIETTLNYCKAKNPDHPVSAYLIHAGLEPKEFTNLFPYWIPDPTITELNLKEGKKPGEKVLLDELLKKLTRTKYTWEELQERPLPEGVDPLKLESYLVDDEFEQTLEMKREEFYAMPAWKQSKLKKEVGLF